jgi:arabinofuranan 3-O-arabinosyltransferase
MTATAERARPAAVPPTSPTDDDGARRWHRIGNAAFVLLAYVPVLLTAPGKIEADTKSYLYLDAGRFLRGAGSMWDPHIGLGTVSHQTLGYLFPVGPFYWLLQDVAGLPSWVAQRLWLGTLVCAAGFGLRYLLRTFGIAGPGTAAGMTVYAFTPYVLQYSSRLSVLLGPWAALPWLIAFVVRALRQGGWRYAAMFAIAIQLVSSINATAMIFALVGPILWFPYSWLVLREQSWRPTFVTAAKVGGLTVLTSLWWMSGLMVQSRYGLNILRFTESIETVSATAYPYEVLRGLGYWFFYGRDNTGLWNDALVEYSQAPERVLLSFMIPTLAVAAAALLRWRYRGYFILLVVVGVAIAVAAAPYDDPSPVGAVFKSFALSSTAGFALRSTARAAPLVVVGFAVVIACGVNALHAHFRHRPRIGITVAAGVAVLAVVNSAGVMSGRYYSDYLLRDEQIPQYWEDALADLDAAGQETRVLALPGADFAAYRWGNTIDPIEPGLMDRHYVARELVPWGSEAAANLLQALDRRVQEGALEPDAVAPIARLMGVGDVLLRMDLETDRFALIPAVALWKTFTDEPPAGLGPPTSYGEKIPGRLQFPEVQSPARPVEPDPAPVAVLPVEDPVPIVRARSGADPLVVAGDGEGLVDLAAAGLLDGSRAVLYAATVVEDPELLRSLPDGATLVLTDSHRKRGLRWSRMRDNYGYTEQAGEEPLADNPLDQRLDVFPGAGDDSRTVTVLEGVANLQATGYGTELFGFNPSERPAAAFDGDDLTGWRVAGARDLDDERLLVELAEPVTTDHIEVSQPQGAPRSRYITRIAMTFDGTDTVVRSLGPESRRADGQRVEFPRRTFRTLEIRIAGVRQYRGLALVTRNAIGFNEIRIVDEAPGATPVRVREVTRLPTDLLGALGDASLDHPLAIVLSRDTTMDTQAMHRRFTVPGTRTFGVEGTVQLSSLASGDAIDRALGLPGATQGGLTARSTSRIPDPLGRASQALDGDSSTAWNAWPGSRPLPRLRLELPAPVTVDRLDLEVVVDGRHSTPRRLEIESASGETRTVDLPDLNPRRNRGTVRVPVDFEPMRSRAFTVTVRGWEQLKRSDIVMPIAIAELGIPGVRRAPVPEHVPDTCRSDLLEIDGRPFPVRIVGTTAAALAGPVPFEPCGTESTVTFDAGDHDVRSLRNPVSRTGFDVTRIALVSGAGGAPATLAALDARDGIEEPRVEVMEESRTSMRLRVDGATEPFWLVLGQSNNAGWQASVDGGPRRPSTLVDGFANGWLVEPGDGAPLEISVVWAPQRGVRTAVVVSAVTAILCVALLGASRRRRVAVHPAGARPAVLDWRLTPAIVPAGRGHAALVAAGGAIVAGALVDPLLGLVVGAVTFAAARHRVAHAALRWFPPVVMAAIALGITAEQFFENYPPRFDWPAFFSWARVPAWLVVVLLGVSAVLAAVAPVRDDAKDSDDDAHSH